MLGFFSRTKFWGVLAAGGALIPDERLFLGVLGGHFFCDLALGYFGRWAALIPDERLFGRW